MDTVMSSFYANIIKRQSTRRKELCTMLGGRGKKAIFIPLILDLTCNTIPQWRGWLWSRPSVNPCRIKPINTERKIDSQTENSYGRCCLSISSVNMFLWWFRSFVMFSSSHHISTSPRFPPYLGGTLFWTFQGHLHAFIHFISCNHVKCLFYSILPF